MTRRPATIGRRWWRAYRAYLLSPAWRAKRLDVMLRNGWVCEHCGFNRAVQVHHLRYPKHCRPGSTMWRAQETMGTLVALCEPCHARLHR